jgi:hypothetical protein
MSPEGVSCCQVEVYLVSRQGLAGQAGGAAWRLSYRSRLLLCTTWCPRQLLLLLLVLCLWGPRLAWWGLLSCSSLGVVGRSTTSKQATEEPWLVLVLLLVLALGLCLLRLLLLVLLALLLLGALLLLLLLLNYRLLHWHWLLLLLSSILPLLLLWLLRGCLRALLRLGVPSRWQLLWVRLLLWVLLLALVHLLLILIHVSSF